jgi:hypothetical protein
MSTRFFADVATSREGHRKLRIGGGEGGARGVPGGGKVTAFGGREPRAEGTAALPALDTCDRLRTSAITF